MTSASLVVAAALAVWGPVWPGADAPARDGAEPPVETAPEAPPPAAGATEVKPLAPAPPSAAPAAMPSIIARGPIDVRARPALVASPRQTQAPSKPLHKQWAFWAIAGGFFVAAVTAVVIATRPAPEAYRGNTPPYYVPFP